MLSFFSVTSLANFNSEKELTDQLKSYAYYMVSLDDGTEIFSKNKNKPVAPAAFCKLAAAITAIEEWDGDLDKKITVTKDALSLLPNEYGVTVAGIKEGESYTRRQLLECMMIHSSNDCESVIANSISKTKEAFVEKIQQMLKRIGCKNTRIVDMFGFDAEGQQTTAMDVSVLVKHGLQYPEFSETFSKNSVDIKIGGENVSLTGSNRMTIPSIADYYSQTVTGGKQTSTTEAGECMAVKTDSNGYAYLTVVMKGSLIDIDNDGVEENTSMTDAKKMIEWAYSNIRFKVVATPGQVIHTVNIEAGRDYDTLNLTAEKEISVLAPVKASGDSVFISPIQETVPKKIKAPIKAGEVICKADVLYANEKIATINLVASQDVKLSMTGKVVGIINSVLTSKVFIAGEIIAFSLLILYVVVMIHGILTGKPHEFKKIKLKRKNKPVKERANKEATTKERTSENVQRRSPDQSRTTAKSASMDSARKRAYERRMEQQGGARKKEQTSRTKRSKTEQTENKPVTKA